ncbi:uncharacterized protein LOC108982579 [Juglans regia]|uniref:Uncharacterized protein LOC108982579 n=1 Tax=Juglans regia TaxID=51240 RepID=A0A2I4F901_JUGRE|nr:uncharacterized protein LOC108982579 [Juglans regia]
MAQFYKLTFSSTFIIMIAVLFTICSVPTVRSDDHSSVLQLHSQDNGKNDADLCGAVSVPASCPINCFRADPVCGVDGVTYWCGCADALCAGVKVAELGFCEVGNGGPGPLSGQALLLVHIVWLIVLGFSVLFGLF